jgi:hypothetical protein
MTNWKPIGLGTYSHKQNQHHTALFDVSIEVVPKPPDPWVAKFSEWSSYSGDGTLSPQCNGNTIVFQSEPREFERIIREIRAQLQVANSWYSGVFLAEQDRQEAVKLARESAAKQAHEDAGKLLAKALGQNG